MVSFLGFNKNYSGLNIGSSAIKLIELKNSGKQKELVHFGVSQVPEEAIVNKDILNSIAVSDSIKNLVSRIKLKNKAVCTGVSGNSVIIKKINLEVKNKKEIEQQVFWEAEQYLPFDVNEVFLDYDIVSKNIVGTIEVIIVAIKKDSLESYSAVVTEGGLIPKVIDLEFFALEHVFSYNYPDLKLASQCIVDIGASGTKILIVQDGIPLFTKEALLGGVHLTHEIQKHLNVSFLDAETLKTSQSSGSSPKEVSELVEIMNENIATEIKRSIDLHQASSTSSPVQNIFLTGGASLQKGLLENIDKITGIQTEYLNPFLLVKYKEKVFSQSEIEKMGPFAAVPVGLALRASIE